MKSKNILIFCASMKKGGAERVISLLLKELENERSIKVYFMMMENGIDYDLPKSIGLFWSIFDLLSNNTISVFLASEGVVTG